MYKIKSDLICNVGHIQYRTLKGKLRCKFCEKIKRAQHRKENPELEKEKGRLNYQKYRDKNRASNKRYSELNRESILKRRQWYNREIRHPLRVAWLSINGRCHNTNHPDFPRWGAKGVFVYESWRRLRGPYAKVGEENQVRFLKFVKYFDETLGTKPSTLHSIDRYPNRNGNYEPGNLRWASPKEQSGNTRANVDYRLSTSEKSPIYYPDGKLITLDQFIALVNLPSIIAKYRYAVNWDAEWILHAKDDGRRYLYQGHVYNMKELSLMSGKLYSTLRARILDYNWSVVRALEE